MPYKSSEYRKCQRMSYIFVRVFFVTLQLTEMFFDLYFISILLGNCHSSIALIGHLSFLDYKVNIASAAHANCILFEICDFEIDFMLF